MTKLHRDRLASYIQTALWASTDDNGEPLDSTYSDDDLAPITKLEIECELNQFFTILELAEVLENTDKGELAYGLANGATITQSLLEAANEYKEDNHIAHDFWLTRTRSGVGFWDGDYGHVGDKLTAIAQTFSECSLYVGDDGLIYQA